LFVTDRILPVKPLAGKFPEKSGFAKENPEKQALCSSGLKGVYSGRERV
jgi:hypothetical protein